MKTWIKTESGAYLNLSHFHCAIVYDGKVHVSMELNGEIVNSVVKVFKDNKTAQAYLDNLMKDLIGDVIDE